MRKGMVEQLQKMKKKGYKLAIVSGVRADIISGMLQIAKIPVEFDYLYGQPPKLGEESQTQAIFELKRKGNICYILGDKMSDLERVKGTRAKTIYFKGGHPAGKEEAFADYTIDDAKELEKVIA